MKGLALVDLISGLNPAANGGNSRGSKIHAVPVIFDYAPAPRDNVRPRVQPRSRVKSFERIYFARPAVRSTFIPAIAAAR